MNNAIKTLTFLFVGVIVINHPFLALFAYGSVCLCRKINEQISISLENRRAKPNLPPVQEKSIEKQTYPEFYSGDIATVRGTLNYNVDSLIKHPNIAPEFLRKFAVPQLKRRDTIKKTINKIIAGKNISENDKKELEEEAILINKYTAKPNLQKGLKFSYKDKYEKARMIKEAISDELLENRYARD
jgi:hypothetical protein